MHQVGLVHRDIKLLNIFVYDRKDKPKIKIGDLGLAILLQTGEKIVKRAGTIAFMAPEIIKEEPSDFKSDIWSLGVVLYLLVASKLPFPSEVYQEMSET